MEHGLCLYGTVPANLSLLISPPLLALAAAGSWLHRRYQVMIVRWEPPRPGQTTSASHLSYPIAAP